MQDCLFCKIVAGEIPSTKVYEDDSVLAFRDIDPQAPEHILVIPKAHIQSAACITAENSAVVAHISRLYLSSPANWGLLRRVSASCPMWAHAQVRPFRTCIFTSLPGGT